MFKKVCSVGIAILLFCTMFAGNVFADTNAVTGTADVYIGEEGSYSYYVNSTYKNANKNVPTISIDATQNFEAVDENGEMTGGHVGGYCFAAHKIGQIERFLQKKGLRIEDLQEIVFYTDSMNDLPLLEFVHSANGRVVATNPDPQLKEQAQKRGWSIVDIF